MIQRLQVKPLRIPFQQSFRHASASRRASQSLWVEVEWESGIRGVGEGCPRTYVSGETLESGEHFVREIQPSITTIRDLSSLREWVDAHRTKIDSAPAAWCAVEMALLDAMARKAEQSIEAFLGLPTIRENPSYSAVLGAESPHVFESQLQRYREIGIRDFKIKLSGETEDSERLAPLTHTPNPEERFRFDANNRWTSSDEVISHLRNLPVSAFAIEEPVAPGNLEAASAISQATGLRIILDESVLRLEQIALLDANPETWIINLRVSKMGGLLRSLELADRARDSGIPLILGCQVGETSLLTRAALTVATAQQPEDILAREGAFGLLLLSEDVLDPPLQFGPGGVLDLRSRDLATAPGWGISSMKPGRWN